VSALPRVAHLTVAPEFVDRILLHDLRFLREHESVTIISAEGPALTRARSEGFRVLTIPARRKMSPLADLRSLLAIWWLLRRERFDLLHTYTPKAGLLGQLAGFLAGVPRRVHGCRGLLYSRTTPALQRAIFRATDRLTGRLAHRTLYLSGGDMKYATEEALCPRDRALLIGSGIDLQIFTRSEAVVRAAGEWRERLGIEPQQTLVLTVGRYVADKGYRELAAAAAALKSDFPDLRYVWVAPVFAGEDGVLSDDLAREFGIEPIVRRVGFVEDMAPVFAAADVLVHPSHREGVPRALMEGAAMGVPIVASDIPGSREIVTHDESALLFPPHDARLLAAALRRALEDQAGTRRRADAALAAVRERFDHRALAARVWDIHRSMLAGGPGLTGPPDVSRVSATRARASGRP
jgi:glycosyltransferase involved in cell wall biosynthesis